LNDGSFLKDVHPGDLKNGVTEYLDELLEPIRQEFKSEEMQKIILNAYPPPVPVQQKKSKKESVRFLRLSILFLISRKTIWTKRATTNYNNNNNNYV
jgi:hypothetical protein